MKDWIGWVLAVAAVAAGWVGYGWRGVALAFTVIVFWLLLQFSRSLRVLQQAARRPVGSVPNAVMLHSKLAAGMTLPQVLKLTASLGRQVATEPETWAWVDAGGDEVLIVMQAGRIQRWELKRAAA